MESRDEVGGKRGNGGQGAAGRGGQCAAGPGAVKHPWEVDVAVLLLFFNRPGPFAQVFGQVRKARPSRLFLYQDGPRSEKDMAGIEACRQIATQIDWDCDVRRNYLDKNQGCDPSGFRSHKWAFSLADKVIVLEDDCVPSLSFFPFCKEMLDLYEHDPRVMMIAGFNTDEESDDVAGDYFFTSVFSCWGWASWRRVADLWDSDYSFMKDDYAVRQLEGLIRARRCRPGLMQMFRDHSRSGKEYFETIFWASMLLNSGLAIMPKRNLINNVGLMPDSVHYSATLKTTPRKQRRIYTMKRFELDFPLRHPRYVTENAAYKERLYKVMAWGHPWTKVCYALEEFLLNLRYGNFRHIIKSLARRVKKWTGTFRYE